MVPILITIVTVAIIILTFRTWLNDVTRRREIHENLYGCVIVQNRGVQDARIEESSIRYAGGLAAGQAVPIAEIGSSVRHPPVEAGRKRES